MTPHPRSLIIADDHMTLIRRLTALAVGLFVLNTTWRSLRINQRLAEIGGPSVAAYVGRAVTDIASKILSPELTTDVAEVRRTLVFTEQAIPAGGRRAELERLRGRHPA